MKRDMELIRLLLLEIEGEEKPDLSGYTKEQQIYHTALLIDAELIEGSIAKGSKGYPMVAHAIRLNWKGHEFLDAARNTSVWDKVVDKMKSTGASLPLPVIQELLITALKKSVGLGD